MLPAIVGLLGEAGGAVSSITSAIKPLSGAVGGLKGNFADLSGGLGKVAGSVGLVTQPLQVMTGALGSFRDGVTALGNQVAQFTQLANPALTQRFMVAAEDLTASIGKGLLPVLDFATKFTRMFADAVFVLADPMGRLLSSVLKPVSDLMPTLTNTMGPFVRGLGVMADALGSLIRPVVTFTGTLVKLTALPIEVFAEGFARGLEFLLAPLEAAAILTGELAEVLDEFVSIGIGDLRKMLGMRDTAGASVGAAVKSVNITNTETFQNTMITKAFSLGTAASPAEKTASMAEDILAWLKVEGGNAVQALLNLPMDAAAALWNEIQKHPLFKSGSEIAAGVGGAVKDATSGSGLAAFSPAAFLIRETGRAVTGGGGGDEEGGFLSKIDPRKW